MDRQRLDSFEDISPGQKAYHSVYGWSFSKKMCDFAVSHMKDRNGNKIVPYTKEKVEQLLKASNVELNNDNGYDSVYVANMAKADYLASSIPNEQYLAKFVKDFIDDPDGYPGLPLTRYVADCIGSGTALIWEDMID